MVGAITLLASVPTTPDELVYIELGRALGHSGRFEIFGMPFPPWTYGPAYVALIAPIFRFAGTAQAAYVAVRELNALAFASAALPAFLIARRVVTRRTALVVAAATIVAPASAYAGKVMTECVAYPVVLCCVLAAIRLNERSTVRRQVALVVLCGLASTVRFELIGLGLALAAACFIAADGTFRARSRSLAPLLALTAVLLVGAAALLQATSNASAGAGAHGFERHGFSLIRFAASLVGSVGAIDLYTGVLPFAGFLFVCVAACRRESWVTPGLRVIAGVTFATGTALLLTSCVYISSLSPSERPLLPVDRYLFYISPLVVLLCAAWIERGAVRTATVFVLMIAAILPIGATLVNVGAHAQGTINAIAFLPWIAIGEGHRLVLLVALSLYSALCAFILSRRSFDVHSLVKPVLVLIAVTSVCACFSQLLPNRGSLASGWLDAHTSGPAIAVWVGPPTFTESQKLREVIGANNNVAAVYYTDAPDSYLQQAERKLKKQKNGLLLEQDEPLRAQYVLTTARTRIAGQLIARADGLAIYKVRSLVRVAPS
jgi:hypothetical protein